MPHLTWNVLMCLCVEKDGRCRASRRRRGSSQEGEAVRRNQRRWRRSWRKRGGNWWTATSMYTSYTCRRHRCMC